MQGSRRRALAWAGAAAIAAGVAVGTTATAMGDKGGRNDAPPAFAPIGTYATGIAGGTSGETSAFADGRLYVTNSTGNSLDVVDARDPSTPVLRTRVDLSPYGAGPNSVDVHGGLVAVAVESDPKTDPGTVVFLRRDGSFVTSVTVGALPDMLTFSDDGRTLLVANEGEPSGYGEADSVDPEGTISIIDTSRITARTAPAVRTVGFTAFDEGARRNAELPEGIRLNGPGARVSQDLEPEYIALSENGRTANVTLQEANAVAVIDVRQGRVREIVSLGTKDHSVAGSGLDPSDRDDGIAIGTWPVRGLYMPDTIASFRVKGRDYLITANEGDARDWPGFVDEARIKDLTLDPTAFPDAEALQADAALGRLNVSATDGIAANGEHEALYSYGARSTTIWRADGRQVWDSGDAIEQRVATEAPEAFNADNEGNDPDNRSDNKGPEPEGVTTGRIGSRTYAFVGLERVGGFMVFDVSDPGSPELLQWANNRDYAADPVGPDSGPEVLRFVEAGDSPTRRPLVIVSNEVTGTVTFYEGSRL
jgi:hypothetical protein